MRGAASKIGAFVLAYNPTKQIGSGGYGEVWLGTRSTDGQEFAIKYLRDGRDAESLSRFQREVRCLAKLNHPNVIRVVAKQLLAVPYYYVMPIYQHCLFDQFPGIVGDNARIRKIFGAVLEALRYAHSEGVIHRDLKPENVLLNSDDDVVVSDFGLGRIIDSRSTRLTVSGRAMGTPFYCAPEQFLDAKRADELSDIFSLGRILYELYAGELTAAAPDWRDVPAPIATIIERATARKPGDRIQSVASMIEAFESAMEVVLGDVEAGSLESLIEEIQRDPTELPAKVSKLATLLSKYADEGDSVHSALMKLPPFVFAELERYSTTLARRLITTFSEFLRSQAWPFSYTDEVSSVCSGFFRISGNPEIRS